MNTSTTQVHRRITWRFPPLFALLALCAPAALTLIFADSVQAAFATVAVTITTLFVAQILYRFRLTRLALHSFILLAPIAIFYRVLYRGAISPGVLLSVTSTTASEAMELLHDHLWITIILGLFLLVALYSAVSSWWTENPFSRTVCVGTGLFAVSLLSIWVVVTGSQLGEQRGNLRYALKDLAREVFPLDLVLSARIIAAGKLETRREFIARSQFHFRNVHVARLSSSHRPETYVIVVGESSRRREWSLYGYGRVTTPRLQEMRRDLVLFDNATSNANLTIYSVTLALTRASPTTWDVAAQEKWIVSLLRQGGCSVDWISNQEHFGGAENRITSIALEANSTSFANDYSSNPHTLKDPFDSNLLPRLSKALARSNDSAEKRVIFLHMAGSHETYRERYPSGFDIFHNAMSLRRSLTARQAEAVDQYDNSVRYTDFILASIIEEVAALGDISAVLYFSDHGERLYDANEPNLRGHGFPAPSVIEIEIPLVVWLSPAFRSEYGDLTRNLEVNSHRSTQLRMSLRRSWILRDSLMMTADHN